MDDIQKENFIKFWFPVILYSGIIFGISGLPRVEIPYPEFNLDKLAHGLEYAILGYLFSRALGRTSGYSRQTVFWMTVAFCMAYGLSDEFHQSFVPGREATVGDLWADTVGGAVGGLIFKK